MTIWFRLTGCLIHQNLTMGCKMAVKCTNCGGAHPLWDCSKPTKSTGSRDETKARSISEPSKVSQAAPVDTLPKPKMGRPRTGYIKAEYNRAYSADLRTIKRLGLEMTVAEWRKTNG